MGVDFKLILLVTIILFCFSNYVGAAAITIGNSGSIIPPAPSPALTGGSPNIVIGSGGTVTGGYNILVDGDFYLDFSVFNQDSNLTGNISFTASSINIYTYDQPAIMPDLMQDWHYLVLDQNLTGNRIIL